MAKKTTRKTPRSSPSTDSGKSSKQRALGEALSLLLPLGPVVWRHLFGGYGLYLEGRIFALIAWDRLYLKVDSQSRAAFLAAGGESFAYQSRARSVELPYCTPPAAALVSPAALLPWAERAVAAARRTKAATTSRAAPRPRP